MSLPSPLRAVMGEKAPPISKVAPPTLLSVSLSSCSSWVSFDRGVWETPDRSSASGFLTCIWWKRATVQPGSVVFSETEPIGFLPNGWPMLLGPIPTAQAVVHIPIDMSRIALQSFC